MAILDRLIYVTAVEHDAKLVSADDRLRQLGAGPGIIGDYSVDGSTGVSSGERSSSQASSSPK